MSDLERDRRERDGWLAPEDYLDPSCPLCGRPGETETLKPVPIGRVMERLNRYEEAGDNTGAERHLLYWLEEAEMGRDRRGELTLHNELMGFYRMRGNREKALHHSKKALILLQDLEMDDTVTAGTVRLNCGTVRQAFGDPEEALCFFESARENYERNLPGEDARLGGLYNNMALTLTALGKYSEAKEMFLRAIEVMKHQPAGELEQAITWLNMADAAEAEMGPEEAESAVDEYLDRAAELLETPSLPQNGYYAFVCEKCAPVFGHYGWFLEETELRKRVKRIREGA